MRFWFLALCISLLAGCGGGAGGDGGGTIGGNVGCTGACSITTPSNLTVAEVNRVVSQAVQEAQARGVANVTIAVVDRVGNVLSVYRVGGAPSFTITTNRAVTGGLEGVTLPQTEYAAISKAITGAFLSSEGNAFSTRTASQIVQQNFNPHETGQPGGPLFGVQFSSMSCSDVTLPRDVAGLAGPHGSPLGLSADPGGLPLYKNGTVVGGIGVIADGQYSLDLDLRDVDSNLDELIAVAGTFGFSAPDNRRADRITVGGRTLRFTDSEALISNPATAPAAPVGGNLVTVSGYFAGAVIAGTAFNSPASGYRADATANFTGLNAFVLVNGANANRYPPIAGTDGLMTQAEVIRILAETLRVTNRTRGQIRLPLDSQAHVNIAVVDTNNAIVGLIRTSDAPVFGTDVSVQKARTAMFFSRTNAAATLNAQPNFMVGALGINNGAISQYVTAAQTLIPGAFTDGIAYSNRSLGLLARPFFPDGINGNPNGPLSLDFNTKWSPFNDGLQLDLAGTVLLNNVIASINNAALATNCSAPAISANGIQIFSGGFPIYRNGVLVGGIGISGDGIDQDNLISFLGVFNAGNILGTGIQNAPPAIRADTINVAPFGNLRYVNCPTNPFLDTDATNVCDGI